MKTNDRRDFLKLLGAAGLSSAFGILGFPSITQAKTSARVVVVGGGFGGATCANYLKRFDSSLDVTLVEPSTKFVTCPFSNSVLAGINTMDFITHDYKGLSAQREVKLVHDSVISIDPTAKNVTLKGGQSLPYDRLVLSPGISFRWEAIENADASIADVMPHAWKAGSQTELLRKQMHAMKDGGVVLIAVPPKPFRAPPAPYERASMMAHYLKENKPKSKIIVIDSGPAIKELKLFQAAWDKFYPGMIERVEGSEAGEIQGVDVKSMSLHGRSGQKYTGDVVNLIPPQRAGNIAHSAGLVNESGWCEVNPRTFESLKHKDIHVIGDACVSDPMPKTGHAASIQAKVCAATIVTGLAGKTMPDPVLSTSIYSLITPTYAISSAEVYRLEGGKIKEVSHGMSPKSASKKVRRKEATFARGWYQSITSEMFMES